MSAIKIFPKKDTYITNEYPNHNFGRDEILELKTGRYKSNILLCFDKDIISEYINEKDNDVYLNLHFANGYIPTDYNISASLIYNYWEMGTGKHGYSPNPENGACWNYPYNGGTWETSSAILTQSFNFTNYKDINLNINNIISSSSSSSELSNDLNILISLENMDDNYALYYYSHNTHTIYPPHLEIYWDDTIYNSGSFQIVGNDFVSNIINNKNIYSQEEVIKLRIKNRDTYPARRFTTSSLYLEEKILPEESYWRIIDYKTKEIIIDFNELGTKIGADEYGNYFWLYCNGLEPERYYQFQIMVKIDGQTKILDYASNLFLIR